MRVLFINKVDRTEIAKLLRASMRRRRPKAELIGTDVSAASPMRFVCDHFEVVEESSEREFENWLLQIVDNYDVSGVFAASNFDLPALARLTKPLEGKGVRVLCPSKEILGLVTNKNRYPMFCKSIGLSSPKIFRLESGERPEFPCVVKPAYGQGSESTYTVKSNMELSLALSRIFEPIVQEFVGGTHYTVDLFGDEAGIPICVVPRVRVRIKYSCSTVSRVDLNEEIIEAANLIGQQLRISGPYNIQMIRNAQGCIFIHDINPRLASGSVLSTAAGAPFARWICDLLIDGYIATRRYSIRDGLEMFRYQAQFYSPPGNRPPAGWNHGNG